jgi:P27 family predicted phage terminase small subunit
VGRPRKPTALKILHGAQPCRINRQEPIAPAWSAICPEHLGPLGRAAWDSVTASLDSMGVLTAADAEAVSLYAAAYQLYRSALDKVERDGLICESDSGVVKPHPLLPQINECRSQMVRLLSQFGMTPASRSSLRVGAKTEEDPLIAFLAAKSSHAQAQAQGQPKAKAKAKAKA